VVSLLPVTVIVFLRFRCSMTALHHAVLTGNAELVRVLLDSGSEVDVIDKRGIPDGISQLIIE
jgi:Ankyrin repeats (many copies)